METEELTAETSLSSQQIRKLRRELEVSQDKVANLTNQLSANVCTETFQTLAAQLISWSSCFHWDVPCYAVTFYLFVLDVVLSVVCANGLLLFCKHVFMHHHSYNSKFISFRFFDIKICLPLLHVTSGVVHRIAMCQGDFVFAFWLGGMAYVWAGVCQHG